MEVIEQLHKLHEEAIKLKERFDKNESPEALEAWVAVYTNELDKLEKIAPKDVLKKGDLLRHSGFLEMYAKKKEPHYCYNDIYNICLTDIFMVEREYIEFLKSDKAPLDKKYNWNLIHTVVQGIAKSRFESTHYADAVEASFKELNHIIKQEYRNTKGVELDGVDLMRKAFSSTPNNTYHPVFPMADNSTDTGRNIQQGYMEIFAGAITGIRNPKTHENLNRVPDEAWEMIVLASHLMRMWDKRLNF